MATTNSTPVSCGKPALTVTFAVIRELIKGTRCVIIAVRLWDFSVAVFLENTARLPGIVTCCGQLQRFCKYRGGGGANSVRYSVAAAFLLIRGSVLFGRIYPENCQKV